MKCGAADVVVDYFGLFSSLITRYFIAKMRECSEVASIQTYKPFDIVYVADRGQISPVHIILSGRCSIIQYLNMNVS